LVFPTLDEVIGELRSISEDETIEPSSPLATIDVDSLDIMEWVYEIEERAGVQFDESLYDKEVLEGATVAELYDKLRAQAQS
jgi:acyl carrier protein